MTVQYRLALGLPMISVALEFERVLLHDRRGVDMALEPF
jgi:hypothetical protein